ncbi:MAG: hypothetical protein JZU64_06390, partial [Rhodoferax sp.]|nr:hypothetical protein [Rhodoferax sp.]
EASSSWWVMPGILVRGCAALIDLEQSCRQTAHAKAMPSDILGMNPARGIGLLSCPAKAKIQLSAKGY